MSFLFANWEFLVAFAGDFALSSCFLFAIDLIAVSSFGIWRWGCFIEIL